MWSEWACCELGNCVYLAVNSCFSIFGPSPVIKLLASSHCINGAKEREFTVKCSEERHHGNVDFHCLEKQLAIHHKEIVLLWHAGSTRLVIAFLTGLFSVSKCLFVFLFFGEWVGCLKKIRKPFAPEKTNIHYSSSKWQNNANVEL